MINSYCLVNRCFFFFFFLIAIVIFASAVFWSKIIESWNTRLVYFDFSQQSGKPTVHLTSSNITIGTNIVTHTRLSYSNDNLNKFLTHRLLYVINIVTSSYELEKLTLFSYLTGVNEEPFLSRFLPRHFSSKMNLRQTCSSQNPTFTPARLHLRYILFLTCVSI